MYAIATAPNGQLFTRPACSRPILALLEYRPCLSAWAPAGWHYSPAIAHLRLRRLRREGRKVILVPVECQERLPAPAERVVIDSYLDLVPV